eukprot:TRINITY_DN8066_c0_g1_i2.p1 TRINITY_DN8066_c0_g1~~TRINITY_DN8066_c0_g1_i2.p1  ORF type:complete len:175 (+),score=16.87 TRINITY_DN8066_c0_g1_i2:54-578(+)
MFSSGYEKRKFVLFLQEYAETKQHRGNVSVAYLFFFLLFGLQIFSHVLGTSLLIAYLEAPESYLGLTLDIISLVWTLILIVIFLFYNCREGIPKTVARHCLLLLLANLIQQLAFITAISFTLLSADKLLIIIGVISLLLSGSSLGLWAYICQRSGLSLQCCEPKIPEESREAFL